LKILSLTLSQAGGYRKERRENKTKKRSNSKSEGHRQVVGKNKRSKGKKSRVLKFSWRASSTGEIQGMKGEKKHRKGRENTVLLIQRKRR